MGVIAKTSFKKIQLFEPTISPKIMKFKTILSLVAILNMLTFANLITDDLSRSLIFLSAAISAVALLVSLKKHKEKRTDYTSYVFCK